MLVLCTFLAHLFLLIMDTEGFASLLLFFVKNSPIRCVIFQTSKPSLLVQAYANSYVSFGVSAGNLGTTRAEKTTLAASLASAAVISVRTKPLATAI